MNSEEKKDPAKPFLTLDHVTIRLRDRFVFEETSWQIRSDEHWAVIGAIGAGKSTLVKAIAGEVPIVLGRAVYHFRNEPGLSPDGQVARVAFDTETDFHGTKAGFESFSAEQDGEVSVAETILWGSSTEGRAQEGRLREIAQQLGMEHLLGRASHVCAAGDALRQFRVAVSQPGRFRRTHRLSQRGVIVGHLAHRRGGPLDSRRLLRPSAPRLAIAIASALPLLAGLAVDRRRHRAAARSSRT